MLTLTIKTIDRLTLINLKKYVSLDETIHVLQSSTTTLLQANSTGKKLLYQGIGFPSGFPDASKTFLKKCYVSLR